MGAEVVALETARGAYSPPPNAKHVLPPTEAGLHEIYRFYGLFARVIFSWFSDSFSIRDAPETD
jgi:hypothetical protein